MKLKSILTSLLLALCCMGASAQTTYPDAVKRFLTISGVTDAAKGQIQEGLTLITQSFVSELGEELPEGYTAEELAEEYMEKQFLRDFVTILVPTLAEELSIDEINKISDLYDTEEGLTAHAHSQEFMKSDGMLNAVFTAMAAAEKIKAGKKPKKVKTRASKERQKLFRQYCEQGNMMSIFEESIALDIMYSYAVANDTAFVGLDDENEGDVVDLEEVDVENMEVEEQEPVDQKKLDAYLKYLKKNMVNILLNASDNLTDDDLRFLVKVTAMPEFKKLQNAVEEMQEDSDSFAMEILAKYSEWLEGHE